MGENGAGKSTLVNVASGNLAPDEGSVFIGGKELAGANPQLAKLSGLAITYQDDSLIPDLTVAENMALGVPTNMRPDGSHLDKWTADRLERFATTIDPRTPVRELSVAARQIVEIVKAIILKPSVLILDEPTAALTTSEADRLHSVLRELANDGAAIVYITHRLVDVLAIADRVTVLRDGQVAASAVSVSDIDEDRLVELMVGRSLDTTFPDKAVERDLGGVILDVRNGTGQQFDGLDLRLRAGEIVGFAGVEGNGQRDALRALAGLDRLRGEFTVKGQRVRQGVRAARNAGMTFVSGDRRGEAVFPELGVRDNMTAGSLMNLSRGGLVTRGRERAEIEQRLQSLDLRTPSIEHRVSGLSGGNQQKVALGRALLESPSVYLIEEPTQGVDARTRLQIYRLLREQARQGAAVVVVSSDALELAGLCDRVLVFSRGQVVAELAGDDVAEERIVGESALSAVTRAAADNQRQSNRLLQFFRRSDFAPVLLLAIAVTVLMIVIGSSRPGFLSTSNLSNLLFLAVPLGFAALGQAAVMMTGGIDLSIGPLISLTTVAIAGLTTLNAEAVSTATGLLAALGIGVAVGLVNALLVRKLRLQPLIATLATYITVQGLTLLWMSTPGGEVGPTFATNAGQLIGFVPLAFVALIAIAIAGEMLLRRRVLGFAFRAVGSRPAAARRVGVRSELIYYVAYVLSGVFGMVAGVFFVATIQIGDPTLGIPFTLASITAVVLGGMSTWGGRGSVVGAVSGALLLAVIANGTQFLQLGPQAQYYIQGGLLIGSIALYSLLRATGRRRDETINER
ncbi:ATP-binding cassette domain-containing protein [Arthrobacter sp. KNU40]|uniref:ATP-binding cassette domain-containing protein n=1 Tax=Arthrobacter sp. KNU40 TaxID=3447965 RepID=UPI003F5EB7D1